MTTTTKADVGGCVFACFRLLVSALLVAAIVIGWLQGWRAGLTVSAAVVLTLVGAAANFTESGRP